MKTNIPLAKLVMLVTLLVNDNSDCLGDVAPGRVVGKGQ